VIVPFEPYEKLPPVASFTVTSTDATHGERFAPAQHSGIFEIPGGEDLSPQLAWPDAPKEARSFAVTMFDPDAPIPSGFWHWSVADIPAGVTALETGAGSPGAKLPGSAFHLRNDVSLARYVGAAPPPGTGRHRYFLVVHALEVESVRELGVTEESTPAALHFLVRDRTLGRGIVVPWAGSDE
jgi:Raf kinase inhibitor-like YbhB/YbcL family protein